MSFIISIEGSDGSGKTTVIKAIQAYFENRKTSVIVSREPGGVRIAESIRELLLSSKYQEMDARTEALLFAAARRQHFVEKIEPLIGTDNILILDRFLDSSLSYQGCARKIGVDDVLSINEFALQGFRPDLTILLDLEVEIGLKRISSNPNREVNKLDNETLAFHKAVRDGYLTLAKKFPERIEVVDASMSEEEVVSQVVKIIDKRYSDF